VETELRGPLMNWFNSFGPNRAVLMVELEVTRRTVMMLLKRVCGRPHEKIQSHGQCATIQKRAWRRSMAISSKPSSARNKY
jgi:hypothetical protein